MRVAYTIIHSIKKHAIKACQFSKPPYVQGTTVQASASTVKWTVYLATELYLKVDFLGTGVGL